MQQSNIRLEYRVVLITGCNSYVLEDGLRSEKEAMEVIKHYKSMPGYKDSHFYYEKY